MLDKYGSETHYTLSVLFPSRGRPDKIKEIIEYWANKMNLNTNFNTEFIVSIDMNDDKFREYIYTLQNMPMINQIIVDCGNFTNVNTAMNAAARAAKGDIILCASDDFLAPQDWNSLVVEAFGDVDKSKVLMIKDGINPMGHLCTLPTCTRIFYDMWGYIYWEEYPHYCSDTDFTERAKRFAEVIVREDLFFEHLHPDVGKSEFDEVYQRASGRDPGGIIGRRILARRIEENFGKEL